MSPPPLDRQAFTRWLHLGLSLYVPAVFLGLVGIVVANHNDDAFIFFRYVEQLLAGQGLVYNPGERVEGFSSPLWVLILSLSTWILRMLGVARGVPEIAQDLGTVAMVGAWVAMMLAVPKIATTSRWLLLLGATAFLWSPFSCVWARSGMETPLVALLVTSAFLLLRISSTKGPFWAQALGGASLWGLCWVRPEGPLIAGVIAIVTLEGPRDGLRAWLQAHKRTLAFRLAAGILLPTVALFLIRRLYYGVWLPNTYHAKMSVGFDFWGRGLEYVGDFFVSGSGLLTLGLLLFALSGRHRSNALRILAVVMAHAFIVILESGDYLWYGRFMMPVLPLLVVGAVLGLDDLRGRKQRAMRYLAMGVGLIWAGTLTWDVLNRRLVGWAYEVELVHEKIDIGARVFRPVLGPDDTVAVGTGARFVYRAKPWAAYDHRGMVVPGVAHSPHRPAIKPGHERSNWLAMLDKKPTFILWEVSLSGMPPCENVGESGEPLDLPEEFEGLNQNEDYVVGCVISRSGRGLVPFLVRRDALATPRPIPIFMVKWLCDDAIAPLP